MFQEEEADASVASHEPPPTLSSAHTGGRDNWRTPPELIARVHRFAADDVIGLDPASAPENPTRARVWFTPEIDGLRRSWSGLGLVFVNPPYSNAGDWITKAITEARHAVEVVALTAARPGAGWYRKLQANARATIEIEGRLCFVGAESGAPFPSAFSYFGDRLDRFVESFGDMGRVVVHFGGDFSTSFEQASAQLDLWAAGR